MAARKKLEKGLEGVLAAETSLCHVDGKRGRLIYRGYDILDLARHATFEEVAYLLWFGNLPTAAQLEELLSRLAAARDIPAEVLAYMQGFPMSATPMDVLRTAVSAAAFHDPEAEDNAREPNVRKAIRLTAQIATIVAAVDRLRNGLEVVPPDPKLNHAANFLYMLQGEPPDEATARDFDVCLVLHAEHELNASTFAARVTAATLADMYASITTAIGTLKGSLHGGANQRVLEMLQEIGEPERVDSYIRQAIADKRRIPGFGHRVYKTEDPRATVLRRISRELGERTGEPKWFLMSQRVEELIWEAKQLKPNVDFYSASVYQSLGIPVDLFTPIFAVSRIAGWAAHLLEQYGDNRLIRPLALYTGPKRQRYIPIQKRTA
ncbi:MAG: citrate synthase [Deltaproteobacteria bacterium]|nr:citrate synthase [Deltaproteobacteria bacterium]MBI3077525.1 citrate synthase [Deltaproteobacteria bacterium]